MKKMQDDILKVLLSQQEIADKVCEIGKQITKDYEGKNLLMVSVLKGSVVFMADLMRAVDTPARIDFMSVSSYGSGTKTSGVVKIVKDLDMNLEGYDLLLVEDILDSGNTLFCGRFCKNAIRQASVLQLCSTNLPEERQTLFLTIPVLKYRTNLSWDMGWTMRKNTATCRISGYSNQKYILSNLKSDPGRILG